MSRAIHLTGKYHPSGIGSTVPLYQESGDPGFVYEESFAGGAGYPLMITPEQWHWFNFRVRSFQSTGWWAGKFHFSVDAPPFGSTNRFEPSVGPGSEQELILWPGAYYLDSRSSPGFFDADNYDHRCCIGMPMSRELEFNNATYYPVNYRGSDYTGYNAIDWPLTYQVVPGGSSGSVAAYFTPDGVWPHIYFYARDPFEAFGVWGDTYFSTENGGSGWSAAGNIQLFDWGGVPYYFNPAGTGRVWTPQDITVSVSSYWTYGGLYNGATGVATGPVPLFM